MPKGDPNAIRLTKKFVICQKHNLNIDDFPRYEDKPAQSSFTGLAGVSNSSKSFLAQASSQAPLVLDANGEARPAPKKRGRKPRSHYLALEAAELAKRQAEEAAAAAALEA